MEPEIVTSYHRHREINHLTGVQKKNKFIGFYYSVHLKFIERTPRNFRAEGEAIIYILDKSFSDILFEKTTDEEITKSLISLDGVKDLNRLYRDRKEYSEKINTMVEDEIASLPAPMSPRILQILQS